jgi:cytosine/adenosine deaminase-related metal-dependent hydrolase
MGELMGALESIEAGITFLVDHSHCMNSPAHADAAIKALRDTHIRGVFCYGLFINRDWEGVAPGTVTAPTDPDWRYEDARRVRKQHFSEENGPQDLLRFGFAPAEIELCSSEESIQQIQFGRELGSALITGHIATGKLDRGYNFIREMGEKKLLGPDLLFSHCGALKDDELELAKEHQVGISCTPDTELQMAMGPCLSFKAERSGCKHSLGVDVACNNPIDMFQQMRLLLQSERNVVHNAAEGIPKSMSYKCESVLRFATMGGAECVGLKDVIGSITVGKRADLILTKTTSTRLTPVHDPVAALVLYANNSDIDTVLVDGRIVKKDGKFADFDWPKLRKEFLQSTENVMRRAKAAPMEDIVAYLQGVFAL